MILLQAAIAAGFILLIVFSVLLIIVLPTCIYVMYQKELDKIEFLNGEPQKSKLILFLFSLVKALIIFSIICLIIFSILYFTIDLTYS